MAKTFTRGILMAFVLLAMANSLCIAQTYQKVYQIGSYHHFTESVQQTADGGFVFQGWKTDVNLPPMKMSLIKTDNQGVVTWKKEYGKCIMILGSCISLDPTVSSMGGCVQQTSDGGYIMTGSLGDQMVLIKTNNTGAVSWAKTYGSASYGKYVRETSDNGFICVGYQGSNAYIVKTTSAGVISWQRAYHLSTNYNDAAMDVDQLVSGDYVVTGYSTTIYNPGANADTTSDIFLLKLNSSGTLQWAKTFGQEGESEEGQSVKRTADGGYIVAGHTSQTGSGMSASDVFLWKFNSSDAPVSQYSYKVGGFLSMDISFGYAAQPTTDGGYALFGVTTGLGVSLSYFSNFMLKLNSTFDVDFCRSYKDSVSGMPISMGYTIWNDGKQLANGGYVVGGCGMLSTGMGLGYKIVKTDNNGFSGCSEKTITPVRSAFAPAAETLTLTDVATGSASEAHIYVSDPSVTVESICDGAPLTAEAGNNKTACVNQSVTLGGSPTADGGNGSYTYSWAPATYLNNTAAANPTCTPTSASPATITYTVTVSSGTQTVSDVVTVTVNTPVTPTFATLGPYCVSQSPAALPSTSLNGVPGTWNPAVISTTTAGTVNYVFTPSAGQCATTAGMQITVNSNLPVDIDIVANPAGPVCSGTTVNFTSTATNPGTSPTYQWYLNGASVGNSSTYSNASLANGDKVVCRLTSNLTCASNNPALSDTITMVVSSSGTAGVSIQAFDNPACTHTQVSFTATPVNGGTAPAYQWYVNGNLISGATNSTYATLSLVTGDLVRCRLTSNASCVSNNPAWSNTVDMIVSPIPIANAGHDTTYYGTPILLGTPSNGPGVITWSPPAGLSSTTVAQPTASPTVTTTYTLTINNNGCIQSDQVTIYFGGYGHNITGKTRYMAKASSGNPAPASPTYNSVLYNINKVIVSLKSYPGGGELKRDTSNALGIYQFTNVPDGNYIISYDKYTGDTMQTVNDVNAIDVALIKYLIGQDTLTDPSRSFTPKHKKAANVDNNTAINAIDVSRIKAKVGSPYDPSKNFPKGNWVAFDTLVSLAGADLNITLKTIAYGDYDASGTKYKDSAASWGQAKSVLDNMIIPTEELVYTGTQNYFEVPLLMGTKMNEFSALGLELTYPSHKYRLVSAYIPGAGKNQQAVKINPTLDEILAEDNDLLVTEHDGIIRVVYATTRHFDLAGYDEVIRFGFQPLANSGELSGMVDFEMFGTGVIGDQYGMADENAFLMLPKIFVNTGADVSGLELTGFPNPFYGTVKLSYTIPESGSVKLSVYNLLGEKVEEMVAEQQNPGNHAIIFSREGLSSGIFIFKLEFFGLNKNNCVFLKMNNYGIK
ncbi:MAG TPA: hypothetical protein PKL96_07410 [Bacteroidales bacterium]|nr:hypothetical protein [Bacteroidales bacterium]